jgi:hypothetical protein
MDYFGQHRHTPISVRVYIGITLLQAADGGDSPHIWRVAVIILNKQSRTADKGLISGSHGTSMKMNFFWDLAPYSLVDIY